MTGKRYAVLDANNVVVNHILIKDPLPAKYYPGYGKTLVPLEECDVSAGASLDVVKLKIAAIPQIGDTLDLNTGTITKFEPVLKQDPKSGEMTSSAPAQKFTTEVDPKTYEATVTEKPAVETKEGTKEAVKGGK